MTNLSAKVFSRSSPALWPYVSFTCLSSSRSNRMTDSARPWRCRTLGQSAGGKAEFWRLDVSREADVEGVWADFKTQFGRIDVVVNNAGISGVNKPTHEITEHEWNALMAVNVKGVFFCTKHVIPHMRAAGAEASSTFRRSMAWWVLVTYVPTVHRRELCA